MKTQKPKNAETDNKPVSSEIKHSENAPKKTEEIGGVDGLEPTRYGDWENNGRCTDF